MEKSKTRRIRYPRLLSLRRVLQWGFLLLMPTLFPVFAENVPVSTPLLLQSVNSCRCGEECVFRISVQGSSRSGRGVSYSLPVLPSGVRCVSQKKDTQIRGSSVETIIELVFVFDTAGVFELPAIPVKNGLKKYAVQLPSVEAAENPQRKSPSVFWKIIDEKEGESLSDAQLELCVRYVKEIKACSVPLQEYAVIKQLEPLQSVFDEQDWRAQAQGMTASLYRWLPLQSGFLELPTATLTVTGTNGKEVSVQTPAFFVQTFVRAPDTSHAEVPILSQFAAAFEGVGESSGVQRAASESSDVVRAPDAEAVAKKISDVRAEERSMVFPHAKQVQRRELETQLGITDAPNEPSLMVLYAFSVLATVCVIFICIGVAKKRHAQIVLCVFLGIASLLGVAVMLHSFLQPCAVYAGGFVRTIPDEASSNLYTLPAGTRVVIKKQTGNWFLIHYSGSAAGWISADSLFPINCRSK